MVCHGIFEKSGAVEDKKNFFPSSAIEKKSFRLMMFGRGEKVVAAKNTNEYPRGENMFRPRRTISSLLMATALAGIPAPVPGAPQPQDSGTTRTLRFVQDDAQDYMVSKIYRLKYVQSNDISPFVQGMIMRYNMNSSVGSIVYGNDNAQMLTVTCPAKMMPYVDDFIRKVDRDIKIDGKTPDDVIRGTGITRAVYRPKYRSGQAVLNVLVNSVIGEGPYGSVYAWDANSNQIYWKDNSSNTSYVYQFLGYLDRPAPQINLNFNVYEVRESTLRDIGIEYLAWKNGPGMNIFETAFDVFSVNSAGSIALQSMAGPAGGFFTAPQFDMSFVRFLQQSGNAEITNTATLTVSNSDTQSYELYFSPEMQNIVKSDNDQSSVAVGAAGNGGAPQIYLKIIQPIVNIHYGESQPGYPASEAFSVADYHPGAYQNFNGTLFFGYDIRTANAVERNNTGAELVETGNIQGNSLIPLKKEVVLGCWELDQNVDQVIGVPWLCDIPLLKYLFSTTTTSRERTKVCLTVTAELLDTAKPDGMKAGELKLIR